MDPLKETLLEIVDTRGEAAEKAFNNYQNWFASLDPTELSIDAMLGGVRIRCFGNAKAKQEAWDKDWRSKHPEWGPVPAGMSVSSEVPEIWCDLKQTSDGQIILPMHIIGHEMAHTLRIKDKKIADPDTLTKRTTYKKQTEK